MPTLADLPLRQIPVVEPFTTLDEVMHLISDDPLKTVAVIGDEQFFGLYDVAARDSGLVPSGADISTLEVGPYMHPTRAIGYPEMTVVEALALLRRRGVEILPVVRNHTYLGVATLGDLEAA